MSFAENAGNVLAVEQDRGDLSRRPAVDHGTGTLLRD
jgi:hypothetical protein